MTTVRTQVLRGVGWVSGLIVGALVYWILAIAVLSNEYGGIESSATVVLVFSFLPTVLVSAWTGSRLVAAADTDVGEARATAAALLASGAAFVTATVLAVLAPSESTHWALWEATAVLGPIAAAVAAAGVPRVVAVWTPRTRVVAAVVGGCAVLASALVARVLLAEEFDPARKDRHLPTLACAPAATARYVWVPDCIATGFTHLDPLSLRTLSTLEFDAGALDSIAAYGRVWAVYLRDLQAKPYAEYGVVTFDARGRDLDDIDLRSGGLDSIAAGADAVWATDYDANAIIRIEPDGFRYPVRLPIPDVASLSGDGIAFGFDAVWIAGAESVHRLDVHSYDVVDGIPVRGGPTGLAVGGNAVWATSYESGTLSRIDPRTGRTTRATHLCEAPQGVEWARGYVWVACRVADEIVRVDPRTLRIGRRIAVGYIPETVDRGGGALWVTYDSGSARDDSNVVTRIDLATATDDVRRLQR